MSYRVRITGYDVLPVEDFLAQYKRHPQNARVHSEHQRDVLAGALDDLGIYDAVIVSSVTGYFIDGHLRADLYEMHAGQDVPFLITDLNETEHAQALLSHDFIAQLATYERDKVEALLHDVQTDNERVQALMSEIAQDVGLDWGAPDDVPEDAGAQIDRAEELNEIWQVQPGDLWIIESVTGEGEHRLLCGDSTNEGDVARLMGGNGAALVVTDPPYGVSYASKNEFLNTIDKGNRIQTRIANDHATKEETQALWLAAFSRMHDVMLPGAVVYCFMPQGGDQMMMMLMMMKAGIEPRHELIWLKNNHVLGRVDYAYKHEPIMYAWKKGGHKFYGDFQTSILEFSKPQSSELHPTMKPVELVARLIDNSSQSRECLYDPFGGSGTTMVACEQLSRQCRMMEIEPKYCAVILERMKALGCACRKSGQ